MVLFSLNEGKVSLWLESVRQEPTCLSHRILMMLSAGTYLFSLYVGKRTGMDFIIKDFQTSLGQAVI